MDVCAIIQASDNLLDELGLSKVGDRLSLKGFCTKEVERVNDKETEHSREQKRSYLEAFFLRKKVKKSSLQNSTTLHGKGDKIQVKTKKIQIGWKHFSEKENKFTLVPLAKGGGSRMVDLPLSSNRLGIMKVSKELFFPNGESFFGNMEDMGFDLANFKDEAIHSSIRSSKGTLPFTLQNYIHTYKAKTVRIYLRSQKSSTSDNSCVDDNSASDLPPMLHATQNSSLIGSTDDRRAIVAEQNKAYEASLKIDRAKDQSREDALKEKLKQEMKREEFRRARLARVPEEPTVTDNSVAVRVRHPPAGLQSRRFLHPCCMSSIYDWAGSLSTEPEDFKLFDPNGILLHPSSVLADPVTLTMVPSDDGTPCLSLSDEEVEFKGFGKPKPHDSTTDTVLDLVFEELDENPEKPKDMTDTDTKG